MSYWDEIIKNNAGTTATATPTVSPIPGSRPSPASSGGFWQGITKQYGTNPADWTPAPVQKQPIQTPSIKTPDQFNFSDIFPIPKQVTTNANSTPQISSNPRAFQEAADFLFNPKGTITYPKIPFTTPQEQKDIPDLVGPRIVTGTAKGIMSLFTTVVEGVPNFLVRTQEAINTFKGKKEPIKLPFNPERIGLTSPDQKTVTPLGELTLNRVNELDKEKPNTPNLNLVQAFGEHILPVIINGFITGDVTKLATQKLLAYTASSPTLGISSQSIKGLTPQEAFTEVSNRFIDQSRTIISKNMVNGQLTRAGQNQLMTLISETKRLGTAFSNDTIPSMKGIGRLFDELAIRLNQDVANLGMSTGLTTPVFKKANEAIPGFRPQPGQVPAFGLSTQGVEPVGFGKQTAEEVKNRLVNSEAFDVQGSIKAGDIPRSNVYKSGNILKPEFAQGRIDDIAQKLDMYQKGLGQQFRASVDVNNVTMKGNNPEGLVQQAINLIDKNAGVTTDQSLMAVHNTNALKLSFAERTGGLANPSIAIIDAKKQELTGFGDISLIGSRGLVEPGKMNKGTTYPADVYSPRYPSTTIEIAPKEKQIITDQLKKYEDVTGTSVSDISFQGTEVSRSLENSPLVEASFLDSKGIKIPTKYDENGVIDKYETQKALRAITMANSTITNEYLAFIDKIIHNTGATENFFAGWTNAGRKRLVPVSAENASKIMNKEGTQGGEGFFYGLGSIRAKAIRRFKNITEIRSAKNRIVSTSDFANVKATVQEKFNNLWNSLEKYAINKDSNQFIEGDHQAQAIGDFIAGDTTYFYNKFTGVPDGLKQKLVDFRKDLINMPTEYFETKYKRPVKLSEFNAAVVPKDVGEKTLSTLKNNGITNIKYYDPKITGDRLAKIQELQSLYAFSKDLTKMGPQGKIEPYGNKQTRTSKAIFGRGHRKPVVTEAKPASKNRTGNGDLLSRPTPNRQPNAVVNRSVDQSSERGLETKGITGPEEIAIQQANQIDVDLFRNGKISRDDFVTNTIDRATKLGLPAESVTVFKKYIESLPGNVLKQFSGIRYVSRMEPGTVASFEIHNSEWYLNINPSEFGNKKFTTGVIIKHEIGGHATYSFSKQEYRLAINSEVDQIISKDTSESSLRALFSNKNEDHVPTIHAYHNNEVTQIHRGLMKMLDHTMAMDVLRELGLVEGEASIKIISKTLATPYFEATKDIWNRIEKIIKRDYEALWSEEKWNKIMFRTYSHLRNEVMARYVEKYSSLSPEIKRYFVDTKIGTAAELAANDSSLLFKDLNFENVSAKIASEDAGKIQKKKLEPKVEGETLEEKLAKAKEVLGTTEKRVGLEKKIEEYKGMPAGEHIDNPSARIPVGDFFITNRALKHFVESRTKQGADMKEIMNLLEKAVVEPDMRAPNKPEFPNTKRLIKFFPENRKALVVVIDGKKEIVTIHIAKVNNLENFKSKMIASGGTAVSSSFSPEGDLAASRISALQKRSLDSKNSLGRAAVPSSVTAPEGGTRQLGLSGVKTIPSERLSDAPKTVKSTNVLNTIIKADRADRLAAETARKEMKKIAAKENLLENLKIKLPQNLQDKAMELAMRKEVIDANPMKALVKFMARRGEFKGHLPEVTGGVDKGKFARMGDRFISEATGINDSEEARAAFDKYMETRKKFEQDMSTFSKDKQEFLKKARGDRNQIIENQKVGASIERTERHINELLGNEAKRKARIERLKQKENETQANLKALEVQRAKYTQQVANAHLNEAQKKSFLAKFKTYLSPIAQTDKTTQQIYLTWESSKIKGKEEANKLYEKYAGHAQGEMPDIMEYEAGANTPWIRNAFDDLFTEATRAGLKLQYKDNYIPHVYREKPEQIKAAIVRYMKDKKVDPETINMYKKTDEVPEAIAIKLKINPTFQKLRTFPTYKLAIEYGLTPRFRTVAEHLAYYREELDKTLANRKLIDDLIKEGKVLDAYDAPEGWLEVKFPGRQFRTYYGPKDLADALNGQFRDEEHLTGIQTVLKYGAKVSRIMQEITLSAGIPGTNINFFSIGQAIKMLTTGVGELSRLKISGASTSVKAAYAFVRANFNKASIKFFKDNQKYVDLMAERNISLGRRIGDYAVNHKTWRQILTYNSLRDIGVAVKSTARDIKEIRSFRDAGKAFVNVVESRAIGIPKDIFDKLFNEKTFTSFMPQMQLQVFKDIFNGAQKAGMLEIEAADFAARTVQSEFGLINGLGRTKTTQDAFGSIFFAPKFRESIINVFAEGAKSYSTQFRNAAYGRSRSFVIGMIVTFLAYNYLNRQLNDGDNMWDNESGKEFDLKIPLPNGRIIYTSFMPSVLSFVRNMGSAIIGFAKGDAETGIQKAGTLFSMPLKAGTEIISNKDYFGRPIYDIVDTPYEKAKKAMAYLGLGFTHPYFKEFLKYFQGTQDIYQTLSIASELPIKFSTQEKAAMSDFYTEKQAKTELNARQRKDIGGMVDTYDQVQKLKLDGSLTQAEAIINELSDKEYDQYKMIMKYEEIQTLRKNKQTAQAKEVLNALTNDEYLQYQAIGTIRSGAKRKDTLQKKISGDKPTFYNGQQVSNTSFIESVATYANAIGTDPITAFKRIVSGQKIRRVDNGAIIVERMSLAESIGVKKDRGATADMRMDHRLSLELGGDNSVDNLVLVPYETWKSYTPVENHLGKLLRDEKISKQEAQRLILEFKDGKIPAEDIMKL